MVSKLGTYSLIPRVLSIAMTQRRAIDVSRALKKCAVFFFTVKLLHSTSD